MDRSAVKAIVDREIELLMARLGIPHWKIKVDYDLNSQSEFSTIHGECNRLINYNQANISLNPNEMEDEEHCLKVLRHELFHVVLAPMDIVFNAVNEALDDDMTLRRTLESVRNHSIEQTVINLERMYHGLTHET